MQNIHMIFVCLVCSFIQLNAAAKEQRSMASKPKPCPAVEIVDKNAHISEGDDFLMLSAVLPKPSKRKSDQQSASFSESEDILVLSDTEDSADEFEQKIEVQGEQNLFSCTLLKILEEGLDQLPQSIADAEVRTLQQGRKITLSLGQKYIIEMMMHIKPSEG